MSIEHVSQCYDARMGIFVLLCSMHRLVTVLGLPAKILLIKLRITAPTNKLQIL